MKAAITSLVVSLLFVLPATAQVADDNQFRRIDFSSHGISFVVKDVTGIDDPRGSFQFRYKSAAVGDSVRSLEGTQGMDPVIQGNEVHYRRPGAVLEKFRITERGVEQRIVLERNFLGNGDLTITGEVLTTLGWAPGAMESLSVLTFYSEDGPVLSFGPAVVTDAEGRQSEVKLERDGSQLAMVVEKTWLQTATYPVEVRSFILALTSPARKEPHTQRSAVVKEESTVIPATTLYSKEDMPVWRAQLRIVTSDVAGGGTYDHVEVKLNSDNSTWLYKSTHDFIAGDIRTYDLILDKVRLLRDIQYLYISKPGNEPWYIKSYEFYVNGIKIYAATFDNSGLMLGVNGSEFVSSWGLRNHTLWRTYVVPPPPTYFSAAQLESRIAAHIGDYLETEWMKPWTTSFLRWDSPAVWAWGESKTAVFISLYLQTVSGLRVRFSLDLEFSCGNGKLFVATRGLMMDYPVLDSYSLANKVNLQMLLQTVVPMKIQSDLQKVTYTDSLGQPSCPAILLSDRSVFLRF
jgi:hypothetical protein